MKKEFIMDFQPTIRKMPEKRQTSSNVKIFNMGCLDSPNRPIKKVTNYSTNKLTFKSSWE